MKQKNKKKKIIIISVVVILLLIASVGGFFLYRTLKNKDTNVETKTVEVLDTIKDYDYHLEDRDTELYKETFLQLKDLLEKTETVDYEKYAEYLATLFLVDLYTIDNKISKYDVGSLDFIYPEEKEKFQNKVMDSMYKMVVDNSSNTRKQELPIVKDVKITKKETTKYQKDEITLDGYLIKAFIDYEKNLGYDKEATLTIVKEEKKLYVVNITTSED